MNIISQYFITYVNYPISGYLQKHINILEELSGKEYDLGPCIMKIVPSTEEQFEEAFVKGSVEHVKNLVKILNQLIQNVPYDKIAYFYEVKLQAENFLGRNPFSTINRNRTKVYSEVIIFEGPTFLYELACYSLLNFLESNKQEKIKCCPHCKLFFIARDIKRKICYDDSCLRKDRRLRKERQRNNDPLKYM